jgi:SAM-dependent methyltransferase
LSGSHDAPLLVEPNSLLPLRCEGDAYLAQSGERYEIEGRTVRMLRHVDPDLARELEAQAKAVDEYSDPRFLMPRYERELVRSLFGHVLRRATPIGAILDAGCGIGILGRLFPDLGLVGLDASIALLRRVDSGYRLLVEGSAEALPFPERSFDLVVALNTLHHIIEPRRAMQEFARVLKPGGTFVAVDPRKTLPVELAKRVLRRKDQAFAPTHKAFHVNEYGPLVEQDGLFQIEECRRLGFLTLLTAGGIDAARLPFEIREPERVLDLLRRTDQLLFKFPGVARLGLNLAVRATRTNAARPWPLARAENHDQR